MGNNHGKFVLQKKQSTPKYINLTGTLFRVIELDLMNLYHITPQNKPYNHEEWPFLKEIKTNCTYDLYNPMYFGLTEEFTRYYDDRRTPDTDWRCVHLKFRTLKKIRLIILDDKPAFDINYLLDLMKYHFIDGFIANDDKNINWNEICLVKPYECLEMPVKLNHDNLQHIMNYYDYIDEEEKILKRKIIE